MIKFIQGLSAYEAAQVLKNLLDENPGLLRETYDRAVKIADAVDAGCICDCVFTSLSMLHFDDLNGRAGRTQHGYVSSDEATWELFEEVLTPFINDIAKNLERGLRNAAKACCIGIIKGLQMYDEDPDSEFGGCVEDVPREFIDIVVEEWKKGNPENEDIADVMNVVEGGRL